MLQRKTTEGIPDWYTYGEKLIKAIAVYVFKNGMHTLTDALER